VPPGNDRSHLPADAQLPAKMRVARQCRSCENPGCLAESQVSGEKAVGGRPTVPVWQ